MTKSNYCGARPKKLSRARNGNQHLSMQLKEYILIVRTEQHELFLN